MNLPWIRSCQSCCAAETPVLPPGGAELSAFVAASVAALVASAAAALVDQSCSRK